ncbi:uncharacterized protein C8Q71DRAFT_765236 [Rhodofomes roseus]|uniref:Uncharacterized protein n=1 Tax=Rhodofomes roseus TaxID=34475 RepID=A0ABQ8KDB1_9APHY|nr:uncharacterized protein C8Q71DRAFT_765236 [Rhodofomes roseus]KAH9835330.1 hypothetical protein C8Q71DRAFT_765236 [Rhodofomes roseus]
MLAALQHGERLIARQTLSLVPSSALPGSVLSITRPDPTNTNTDSGSPTLPLSTSLISTGSGSSTSTPPASSASSSLPGSSTSSYPASSVPTTSNVMSSTSETSSSASTSPTSVVLVGSHVKTGAVIGGVIGGVVFVLLVIAGLLLYLRIRRQIPGRSRRRSMGEFDSGRPAGQYAGLSSRNGTFEAVAVPPRSHQRSGSRSYPQADSLGMIVTPTTSSAGHDTSPFDEAVVKEGQKPRAGRRRSEYIETVPPLDYAPQATETSPRRARKPSNGSSTRAVALAKLNTSTANNSTSTTATASSRHSRQRSMDRSAYAGAGSSIPSTPTAVSHTHTRGTPSSPTSPVSPYAAEPMSRSTSTNVGAVRRNPTRKPVPSYHSSASAASTEKRQSTSSTPAQSLTPAHSREDLDGRRFTAPDLNHKSSFGDARPVHYLVPDLPPSARK